MPERNHIRVCGMEIGMLIIEGNSVYEIDEECVRKKEKSLKNARRHRNCRCRENAKQKAV